ncbi:hypothetical protein sphantq_00096 [Sphingobium sp. AntQ-1]|uniref:asparagine synthase-related protein n=1 Tax=Sphingobium sp. AntQ-1 TaxID=2930091 RepID=UPI00234EB490|nr:asparagine synthase-related protein [Sphingobium sp. AntQ-1]WCP11716.1 hypothetical protein sphantq_00096 [Sphingobium sp. AntQ-1]
MHHFLIVHAKNVDARNRLLDRLKMGVDHLVPYVPARKKILSLSDNAFFVSTESHDFLGLGEKSVVRDGNLAAFDGYCALKNHNQKSVDYIYDLFRQHRAFTVNDHIDGELCAASYDFNTGTLSILSDFTGLRPIYFTEDDNYFAASNRQMFLNPLLTPTAKLEIDFSQIADLLGKGNKFTDRSFLKGVRLLRPGFAGVFTPGKGFETRRSGEPIFTARGEPSRADYIRSVSELVNNFDTLSRMPGLQDQPIRISLTGGEDSRLVLAAALESSVADRIETFTYGFADNPDIAAAEMVAQKAGVPHVKNIHTPPTSVSERPLDKIWDDLRRHAFRFEGAPGAWDGGAATATQVRLDLVGYFDSYFKRVRPSNALIDVVSRDVARAFMKEPQQDFDPMGILQPSAIAADEAFCDNWLETVLDEGAELNDIPELFYFDFRLPWWGGAMAANVGSLCRIAPLASKFASRTGLKQSLVDRRERKFIFEAMLTLRPDLLELPYLNKKWPDHFQARSARVKLPGTELRLPTPKHPSAPSWHITLAKRGGSHIRDYIRSHDFSGLEEMVDIDRLMLFLEDASRVNNTPIVRTIVNLCEILVLAAGDQFRSPDKIANSRINAPDLITNIPNFSDTPMTIPVEVRTPGLQARNFDIAFPKEKLRNVRIDPASKPSNLVLHSMMLRRQDGTVAALELAKLQTNGELAMVARPDGGVDLRASGQDPHIYLPKGTDLSDIAGCTFKLSLPPSGGNLEIFFDYGNGFTREGMVGIAY